MTVIAACIDGGQAVMGADTASFMDGRVFHDGQKIFTLPAGPRSGEKMTFGVAGRTSINSILRRKLKITETDVAHRDQRVVMLTVASKICAHLVAAQPAPVDADGNIDGGCLALYRGQLWMLTQQDAAVISAGYTAIGAGGDLALGALAALEDSGLDAEQRVRRAIAIAAAHSDGVRVLDEPQLHIEQQ